MASASDSQLPLLNEERTQTYSAFALSWTSNIIALFSFMTGASGIAAGLNMVQAICAILIARVFIAIFTILNFTPGYRYGIPMVVQMTACFGEKFAPIAALARALPALAWTGYNSFLGALGLNLFSIVLFGYNNVWVWLFVFHFGQVVLSALGVKKMLNFAAYSALALLVLISIMVAYIFYIFGVDNMLKLASSGGTWGTPFWAIVATAISASVTTLVNGSDYSRQMDPSSYKKMIISFVLGTFPIALLLALLGMFIVGMSGIWSPIDLFVQYVPNIFVVAIAMGFIILGQFSTNMFANIMPANIVWNKMFRFPWWFCSIFTGCVSLFIVPWYLTTAAGFAHFMNAIGAMLGPIGGIMLVDYWLIRKQKFNLIDLYRKNGQYSYTKGVNMAGLIAMVIGTAAALWNLRLSSIVGTFVAAVVYYVVYKFYVLPKYPQAELEPGYKMSDVPTARREVESL